MPSTFLDAFDAISHKTLISANSTYSHFRYRVPVSQEILMFVCLQKDAKQCQSQFTPKMKANCGSAFAFIFCVN